MLPFYDDMYWNKFSWSEYPKWYYHKSNKTAPIETDIPNYIQGHVFKHIAQNCTA